MEQIIPFSRLRGLSTQIRSFNFKLLHQLLPVNERLSQILPNNSPNCSQYDLNLPESLLHGLFYCDRNRQAAQALLALTRPYDSSISPERAVTLNIVTSDTLYELPVMLVLCTGMNFIWENRMKKKSTSIFQIRSEIECLISLLRRSRRRLLREAGEMICNTIVNFPINVNL